MKIMLGDEHIQVVLLPKFSCLQTLVAKIIDGVNSKKYLMGLKRLNIRFYFITYIQRRYFHTKYFLQMMSPGGDKHRDIFQKNQLQSTALKLCQMPAVKFPKLCKKPAYFTLFLLD